MPIFNPTTIAGTANQVIANGNVGTTEAGLVTLTLPQSIGVSSSPTFSALSLSGLTANGFLYAGTAGLLTSTAAPTNGQLLIGSTGAAPVRASLTAGTAISVTPGAGSITIANTGVTSNIASTGISVSAATGAVTITNTGVTSAVAGPGISVSAATGAVTFTNTGVTSVSLALPSIFTVSGSPVTTAGTLTGTLTTQSANTHFTGPASGSPATPTFRTISLLQNDLSDVVLSAPSSGQILSYNSGTSKWNNTSVLNGNASGTVGVSPTGGGTAWTLISGNSYRADFVHNLGTTNVVITVYDTNNSAIVIPNLVVTTNTNTVRVTVTGNTRTLKVVVVAQGSALVAGGSTPSSVITAEDGVTISTAATKLNFTGQAINVVDAGSGTTNITIGSRFTFFANSLDTPNNVDYAINALAPVTTDPTFTSLNVRSFSNTVEQGVACLISVPTGATQLIVKIRGRGQTAPGTASVVQPRLYYRLLPNNSAVGTWSAAQELANIAIPTNANFQYSTQIISLSTLGLTAGNLYQFEFTRRVAGVTGTNLAANFLMAEITLELS